MTDRELMQMALDALEYLIQSVGGNAPESFDVWFQKTQVPAEALRARLAQPEPEPVAWFMEGTFEDGTPSFTQVCETDPEFYVPLYTAPPSGAAATQREWQGLTDEEMHECAGEYPWTPTGLKCCRAIEQALKEKNA